MIHNVPCCPAKGITDFGESIQRALGADHQFENSQPDMS
jgi:hypothetical protein